MNMRRVMALLTASALTVTAGAVVVPASDSLASSVVESLAEYAEEEILEDETPIVDVELTADNMADFIELAEYKGLAFTLGEDDLTAEGDTVVIDFVGMIPTEAYEAYLAAQSDVESVEEYFEDDYEIDYEEDSLAEEAETDSAAEEVEDGWYAFDGGSGEDYELELGSGSFIDGFEEQLVGYRIGDEVTVVVTFPEEYGYDLLNGQEARFDVTIKDGYHMTSETALSNVAQDSVIKQYPADLYNTVLEELYASLNEQYESYMAYFSYFEESTAEEAESAVEEAEEESGIPSQEVFDFFGVDQEYVELIAKEETRVLMTSKAILAAENVTEESDEYLEIAQTLLDAYGVETLDEIIAYGVSEAQLHWYLERMTAMNLIEANQA